ncbi:hypothetical protein PGB90_004813 [Kerria lacca]
MFHKVKNKAPAEIQITAEQILREAKERDLEIAPPAPKQKISNPEELADYQRKKRRTFEDNIRKNRTVISNWIKYAEWEESQKDIRRARSIYERALDVDHRNIVLWLKYAEMEMKNAQVNHARNVWDRAVNILPRANQFWYKYTYMEEKLGNIAGARQVFEKWMQWEPEEQAWLTYINFEMRYKELDRARIIYNKFVVTHPLVKNWIKYARFEENHGFINCARKVYEKAAEYFGDDYMDEDLFIAFAKFEERQKEYERVKVLYKYALDRIPTDKCQQLYKAYTIYEKKFGDQNSIEIVINSKRKFQNEKEIKENPMNYDAWFDYIAIVESEGNVDIIRDIYERAIANIPPSKDKQHWKRYIYLWIYYAVFEELECGDIERTRYVYTTCINVIPHKHFTFAKIWLLYAMFEIRQKNLQKARKTLGLAIGKYPKNKLFKGYIDLEIQLQEVDRCRKLYENYLRFNPENCLAWVQFAELETFIGDVERGREIYKCGINCPQLDMPELLWKSYIDFEISQNERENARELYEKLLEKTLHFKVWISYVQFEMSNNTENSKQLARNIFDRANKALKEAGEKEERVKLLQAWKAFEKTNGNEENLEKVLKIMPKRVKRRIHYISEDGKDESWEEKLEYIFPEDEASKPNTYVLQQAKQWKNQIKEND